MVRDYRTYIKFIKALLQKGIDHSNSKTQMHYDNRLKIYQYTNTLIRPGQTEHQFELILNSGLGTSNSFWNRLESNKINNFNFPKVLITKNKDKGRPVLRVYNVDYPKVFGSLAAKIRDNKPDQTHFTLFFVHMPLQLFKTADDLDSWVESYRLQVARLRARSILIPIGISVPEEAWEKFISLVFPETMEYFSVDANFAQRLRVDHINDLLDQVNGINQHVQNLHRFMCLSMSRLSCFMATRGSEKVTDSEEWVTTTNGPETVGADFNEDQYDYDTDTEVGFKGVDDMYDGDYTESEMQQIDEGPDSCCGTDMWNSFKYNSRVKGCCQDDDGNFKVAIEC